MTLTAAEREAGYKQPPMPGPWAQTILRRIAGGYLMLTLDGKDSWASYDGGAQITIPYHFNGEPRTRQMNGHDVKLWVGRGWLIPIKGESLLEDGPAQRYRARTILDGPLPRIVRPDGNPLWAIPPT